jgi:HSP20 family protein|tara:strand:+ start:538 stop:960 length:423 start_codon:yes stop_codon:yes gene_type:complete
MSLLARKNVFDIDRLFNDSWQRTAQPQAQTSLAPRVDIRETAEYFQITAELPGVDKDDIHLHVKEGILTLEAERMRSDEEKAKGRVIRQEQRYGKIMRSFNLGVDVEEANIKASFVNGVLSLQAPKVVAKEQESRRIEIS